MTREKDIEKAIENLKNILEEATETDYSVCYVTSEDADTLKVAIQVLEQEPKWIPVSARLPEQYKAVIVTDIETSDTYQSRYIGNGYWECDNGLFMNRIIAWMPLPKTYELPESEE